MEDEDGFLDKLSAWFSGWKFPSLALLLLFFFTLLLVFILIFPVSESAMGRFARDFKIWCFGYKPESGQMEWVYVVMLIMDPLLIAGIIITLWKNQLKEVLVNYPIRILPYAIFAIFLVVSGGVGFTLIANGSESADKNFEFPGNKIRTTIPITEFSMNDHYNKKISLSDFKGKVIIITSFYTSCGKTCPLILMQLKKVMDKLNENELKEMAVLAITMDPKNDDTSKIQRTAVSHRMEKDPFHFLNGNPVMVFNTLDKYGFIRSVNEKTGEIDHANLFVVIDRHSNIAYRFSLGEIQEKWLYQSLKQLIQEKE